MLQAAKIQNLSDWLSEIESIVEALRDNEAAIRALPPEKIDPKYPIEREKP